MTNCFPGDRREQVSEELRSPLLDTLLSLAHMNRTIKRTEICDRRRA